MVPFKKIGEKYTASYVFVIPFFVTFETSDFFTELCRVFQTNRTVHTLHEKLQVIFF